MKLALEYDVDTNVLAVDLTGVKGEQELAERIKIARRIAGLLYPRVEQLELWLPVRAADTTLVER